MKHPLAGNRRLLVYLMVWVAITGIHSVYLYQHYPISYLVAVVDGLVFNIALAGLGLSYWYVVRFVPLAPNQNSSPILVHALGILSMAFLASFTTNLILKWAFIYHDAYQRLLAEMTTARIFLSVLYLLNTTLIYYLIRYYRGMQEKVKTAAALQNTVKEAELNRLKSQINPHFIFNSLNAVSALAISAPMQAREMVIHLSDFLRYSLGKGSQEKNTLAEEMSNIMLYLAIEKVRFGERLQVAVDMPETAKPMLVPNMILQPLFENAIKHGVYESLGPVTIRFMAQLSGGWLSVALSNDYDPESVPKKGNGIGLKNVQERLQLIYGIAGLLKTQKDGHTFTITLRVPQAVAK